MSAAHDLYQVLQVHPAAEPEVIRAAYRALAHKHHPDQGGSEARMAALNGAWTVLGDANARRAYDRERAVAANLARTRGAAADPAGGAAAERTAGHPTSAVLDYGRYQGWSLARLAHQDPDYLLWLARTPAGRAYRAEIEALLADLPPAPAPSVRHPARGRLFGRRATSG